MCQRKNRIIIYSWSAIWSMKTKSGAPSFYKTIDLYIRKGWDVHLILTDRSNGTTEIADKCHIYSLKEWGTDSLISEKFVSKPFLLLKMLRYYCFAKRVTKKIMEDGHEKTLFYAYEIHGVSSAKWASKKYGMPLITRFQGTVATYFKNSFVTKIKQYFHIKALKEKADLVIMTDDGTRGFETLKKLGNPSENIKFWKNGLDLLEMDYKFSEQEKSILRKELKIAEDEYMLLTVSRLQDWKRVDRAIDILNELGNKQGKFKLVIAGDGPQKGKLTQLAKDYGLEEKVVFLGAVAHNKVYDYMSCADIFLSLYDMSNVGNPLLEALALGKCIITLDVGDTNTVIKNNYNGMILNIEELGKIPDIICELYNTPSKKHELEVNAKTYARENLYSWNTRMEMEYGEVINLRRRDV